MTATPATVPPAMAPELLEDLEAFAFGALGMTVIVGMVVWVVTTVPEVVRRTFAVIVVETCVEDEATGPPAFALVLILIAVVGRSVVDNELVGDPGFTMKGLDVVPGD